MIALRNVLTGEVQVVGTADGIDMAVWKTVSAAVPGDFATRAYVLNPGGTAWVPVVAPLDRLDALVALLVTKGLITSGEAAALPA